MPGSLCLHEGVLWVGVHEKTAHVSAFDLDGRALGPGFSFRDPEQPRSAVGGMAVDEDHRLWVADTPASCLRAFNLFGRELSRIAATTGAEADLRGQPAEPTDVALVASDGQALLAVASGGVRRHALQLLDRSGRALASLRSLGDPRRRFRGLRDVAARGRFLYACETGAGRVQVFRDGDFHFAIQLEWRPGVSFEPTAVAPLDDGRMVVATAGEHSALLLLDGSGRLLEVLAEPGRGEGRVLDPVDVVVEAAGSDPRTRVAALDLEGERLQVFNLRGECYGAFEALRRSG